MKVITAIRYSEIFADYGCHDGFENRITFSQGRDIFLRQKTVLSFCGKRNNQQSEATIIRRLKLVPRNAATSLGAFNISVVALQSGSAKGHIFTALVIRCVFNRISLLHGFTNHAFVLN